MSMIIYTKLSTYYMRNRLFPTTKILAILGNQ